MHLICNDIVVEECKAISCDICNGWCHDKCASNEDLVKLLEALSANNDDNKILGVLLWMCPNCANASETKSKTIQISKNTCTMIDIDSDMEKHSDSSRNPICKKYRRGVCHDENCRFSHPAKCLAYCRYGRDGCSGGYNNCKLLHPVLCRGSLNYKSVFRPILSLSPPKRY